MTATPDRRTHIERINDVPALRHALHPKEIEQMMSDAQFAKIEELLTPIAAAAKLLVADHEQREARRKEWEADQAARDVAPNTPQPGDASKDEKGDIKPVAGKADAPKDEKPKDEKPKDEKKADA